MTAAGPVPSPSTDPRGSVTVADQPEAYFNFTGMKATGEFDELPKLGDRMTFEITAECKEEPHFKLMEDGHRRLLIGMKVLEVEPGEITPAPEEPQLKLDEDAFALGGTDE